MAVTYNEKNLALARRAAREGIILLKNENATLPLSADKTVALFGRNQLDTYKGGGGSANLWATHVVPFADGIAAAGSVYEPLLQKYRAWDEANRDPSRNKIYRRNFYKSLEEYPVSECEVEAAATASDTAIFFLGRFTSEHSDLDDVPGDYRIAEKEETLLRLVRKHFKKVVLVLNLPGLMDLSFLRTCPVDALLQTYMPGMEAGNALADLLYGKVSPSGKLPDSFAETLKEYPTNEGYGTEHVVYREGLYMGYRYFDSFGKDVLFPFGFGLSYTTFAYRFLSAEVEGTTVTLKVRVENTGSCAGRETVQCYLEAPDGRLEKPAQSLCAFEKTALLAPGASETVTLSVDLLDFTSYCEETASFILEKGVYVLRVGKHSRDTEAVAAVELPETVVHRKTVNRVTPIEAIDLLKKPATVREVPANLPVLHLDLSKHETEIVPALTAPVELPKGEPCTFSDVLAGTRTPEELAAELTDEELCLIVTGDGRKKRAAIGDTRGEVSKGEGSHSHSVERLGIPASTMQDGPAGVRAASFPWPIPPEEEINGADCICYPCATLLAATWDRALMREVGHAITEDLARYGYDGLCAPGVNLHRTPHCGRNFEYFSEDPLLAGEMALYEIIGLQENEDGTPTGHYATLKHFACNNAESHRLTADSVLTERTARELYLRVFEHIIRRTQPLSIMTSYNKINGIYAAARADLMDGICHVEWGYTGWIMTDWDVRTDAESIIRAGVDIEMPGRYIPVERLEAYGLTRAMLQRRAANLIRHLARTKHHFR